MAVGTSWISGLVAATVTMLVIILAWVRGVVVGVCRAPTSVSGSLSQKPPLPLPTHAPPQASSSKEASRQLVAFAASTTRREASTRVLTSACFVPSRRCPLWPTAPRIWRQQQQQQPSRLLARSSGDEGASTGGSGGGGAAKAKAKKGKQQKGGGGGGEEAFRLDRLLSNRGVGSRTEVTALVRRGRVKLAATGEVIK